MSLVTRLRSSAFVVSLIVSLLCIPYVAATSDASGEGYPISVAAADLSNMLMLTGVASLAAAWEGRRFRAARLLTVPRQRSLARVLVGPLAVSIAAPAVAMVFRFMLHGWDAAASWGLMGVGLVGLASATLFGMAIGLLLPPVFGLPLAALPTIALVFSASFSSEQPWLQFMAGDWTFCCFVDQALDPRAVASYLLAAGAFGIASLAVIARAGGAVPRTVLVLALVLAVGFMAGGVRRASQMTDHTPTIPRVAEPVCDQAQIRVCVWPEHRTWLPSMIATSEQITTSWAEIGLVIPTTYSELAPKTTPQIVSVRFRPDYAEPQSVVATLATGLVDAPCTETDPLVPVQVQDDAFYAMAWLVLVAQGHPFTGDYAGSLPPGAWDKAAALRTRPLPDQVAEIQTVLTRLNQC